MQSKIEIKDPFLADYLSQFYSGDKLMNNSARGILEYDNKLWINTGGCLGVYCTLQQVVPVSEFSGHTFKYSELLSRTAERSFYTGLLFSCKGEKYVCLNNQLEARFGREERGDQLPEIDGYSPFEDEYYERGGTLHPLNAYVIAEAVLKYEHSSSAENLLAYKAKLEKELQGYITRFDAFSKGEAKQQDLDFFCSNYGGAKTEELKKNALYHGMSWLFGRAYMVLANIKAVDFRLDKTAYQPLLFAC